MTSYKIQVKCRISPNDFLTKYGHLYFFLAPSYLFLPLSSCELAHKDNFISLFKHNMVMRILPQNALRRDCNAI